MGRYVLGYKNGKVVKSKVKSKFKSNIKEKFILKTKLGKEITCSANHRILLKNGNYIRAEDLKLGDCILTI